MCEGGGPGVDAHLGVEYQWFSNILFQFVYVGGKRGKGGGGAVDAHLGVEYQWF